MTDNTEMQMPDTHELAVRIFYEEFGMDAPRNKAVNAIERAIIMERQRQSSATTTEMQIPDDVMEVAREAFDAAFFFGEVEVGAIVKSIAGAILAERERCARIAEGNAKSFNFQQALAEGDDMEVGAKSAQIAIAAKIRSVDK